MKREKYYRSLFLIAALWAWLVSVPYIFIYRYTFPLVGMKIPESPVWFLLSCLCVATFGLGYFLVSRNIGKNQGIVIIGMVGKIMVFILFLFSTITGEISPLLMISASADLLFAVLFAEFLLFDKRKHTGGTRAGS
jgi:hypothetical protein